METITLANLPNQEIIKEKADQILGRLNDQTIVARAVKSVQRGNVNSTGSYGSYETIRFSPVNMSKSILILTGKEANGINVVPENITSSSFRINGQNIKVHWQVIEYY